MNLDLTVVQSDERAVPFYDLVFEYATQGDAWSFADPYLRRRGKGLLPPDRVQNVGPHDLLGFRNHAIPNRPDIVILGDSLTYGVNVDLDSNWPSRLAAVTGRSVYTMALPGWAGLSYRYMIEKALRLEPRLVVVALYMGNDSLENALMAYSTPYWNEYRPRPDVDFDALETEVRPGGELEKHVIGRDPEVVMPFQVAMRFDVNDADRLIATLGYEIQSRIARELIAIAKRHDVPLVFTVLPTKERVHAPLLEAQGVEISDAFRTLLDNEARFHEMLIDTITGEGGHVIDVLAPLTAETSAGRHLYPLSGDGHPASTGYDVIARAIAQGIEAVLPESREPAFWQGVDQLPGAARGRAIALDTFLEALAARGFEEDNGVPLGFLGGVRVEPGFDFPVVKGWSFDGADPTAATVVAVVVDERVVLVGQTRGSRRDVEEAFDLERDDALTNAFSLRLEGTCDSLAGRPRRRDRDLGDESALSGAAEVVRVRDQMWARFLVELLPHLPSAAFRRAVDVVGPLRMTKDQAEVDALAAAGAAVDRIAGELQSGNIPLVGRTEAEVSADLSARIVAEGHQKVNFAIVAAGENAASPHHHAGSRVIQEGEIVLCDFGGTMDGYCSDITRCVFTGEIDPEVAEAYAVLHEAQAASVAAATVGTPCEEVDRVGRRIIADAGYGEYFVHRTGHGIGLEEHEDPYIVEGNGMPLAAGHAFSVEPGIYVPGKWGMRLEDIVVASPDGPRAVNAADHELVSVG